MSWNPKYALFTAGNGPQQLLNAEQIIQGVVNQAQDALRVTGNGTAGADGSTPLVTVGNALPVRVTLATSASPNYSTGDSLGGKIVLANAVRVAGGASDLLNLLITDKANKKPGGYIYIFDADPTAATLTDNAAAAFSTDVAKIIARLDVSAADYVTTGTIAVADIPYVGRQLKSAATTSLWAAFVLLTDAIDLGAVDDIDLLFNLRAAS